MTILPCPFCGGAATLGSAKGDAWFRDGKTFYWVEHEAEDCPIIEGGNLLPGMGTGYFDTAEQAVVAWNRRA